MKPKNAIVRTDPRWTLAYNNGAQRRKLGRCAVEGAYFGSCRVLKSFPGKGGRTYLQCDCGTVFDVLTRAVWRGQVSRCANCGHAESNRKIIQNLGLDVISDPPLRALWLHRRTGMISRCYNPKAKAYKNYGGRLYGKWIICLTAGNARDRVSLGWGFGQPESETAWVARNRRLKMVRFQATFVFERDDITTVEEARAYVQEVAQEETLTSGEIVQAFDAEIVD